MNNFNITLTCFFFFNSPTFLCQLNLWTFFKVIFDLTKSIVLFVALVVSLLRIWGLRREHVYSWRNQITASTHPKMGSLLVCILHFRARIIWMHYVFISLMVNLHLFNDSLKTYSRNKCLLICYSNFGSYPNANVI